MIYVKNLPWWERAIRLAGGAVLVICAFAGMGGTWQWLLLASGIVLTLTGFLGFCPACAMAGRRLKQQARRMQEQPRQ